MGRRQFETNGLFSEHDEKRDEHGDGKKDTWVDRTSARGQWLAIQSRERPLPESLLSEEIFVFICVEWDQSPSETDIQTALLHFVSAAPLLQVAVEFVLAWHCHSGTSTTWRRTLPTPSACPQNRLRWR